MTTHDRRDLQRIARSCDVSSLTRAMMNLGQARLDQHRAGGPLLAAFGDYCWMTSHAFGIEQFDAWLAEAHTQSAPTDGEVLRARQALTCGGVRL
jgi:hypothetical protein